MTALRYRTGSPTTNTKIVDAGRSIVSGRRMGEPTAWMPEATQSKSAGSVTRRVAVA